MSVENLEFIELVESSYSSGQLPEQLHTMLRGFYKSYVSSLNQNGCSLEEINTLLCTFLEKIQDQLRSPHQFPIFHKAIRSPFDYYRFSIEFIHPLIDMERSRVVGNAYLADIDQAIARGENVIFLANHQTEPDAQVLNLFLEKAHPQLIDKMVFVAGHRVITDPLAVPFSMGCNLLCIWSKRHMDYPPEQKISKLEHNQRTMRAMQQLLEAGGTAIYVAPSGGRDRPDSEGNLDVSPFDPQAVEMFLLSARQCARPTHIYPLALNTYALMPPPDQVIRELGEPRFARFTPVHMAFGAPIDIQSLYQSSPEGDRRQQREWRAKTIWNKVQDLYIQIK